MRTVARRISMIAPVVVIALLLAPASAGAGASSGKSRVVPNPVVSEPRSGRAPARPTESGPFTAEAFSPAPAQNFLALDDIPGDGGFSQIPPDTMGAVGPDRVFTNLNNNYRVLDKATGAALSTQTIGTFWASTGATGVFDPQTLYDPYNNRWIVAATSNSHSADSSILVGVSLTSDPQGSWYLFRFDADPGNTLWADYPTLGFNKNWIAVGVNMFTNTTNAPMGTRLLVADYPSARSNIFSAQYLTPSGPGGTTFTLHPAVTFSSTEETLYLVEHVSSASATYRFWTITGTSSSPTLTLVGGGTKTNPLGGWTQPTADSGGDILPQQCLANCPGALRKINAGDARVMNVVFRNGGIYYAQTIGIASGPGAVPINHTAAQWVQLNTTGDFVQGGRVEDPTATPTNGGVWYAYPTITVNANGDILLGFSDFESDDFADAGYAFHAVGDPPGTMQAPFIFKEGEDYYHKLYSSTRNRWGDYSNTVVDPSNDLDMWTIQEYAATRNPAGCVPTDANNCSKWSTWWAKVAAGAAAPPSLAINDVSAKEGNSGTKSFNFTVTRSGNLSGTTTVSYATADGTAKVSAGDYLAASGTLTFLGGDSSETASVTVKGDTKVEPNETFFVNLSVPGNGTISDGQGKGTIQNDDAKKADLKVTKADSPDPVALGKVVTYTLTVTNRGPSRATGVTLVDKFPNGGLVVSAKPRDGADNCAKGTKKVTCNLGNLADGATDKVTIKLIPTIDPATNRGTVSSDVADPISSNNSATAKTQVGSVRCTQIGTNGADVLTGTARTDVLCGLGGNDMLKGLGGNDVLGGGAGNDQIIGGPGFDIGLGGNGNDRLNMQDGVRRNDAAYGQGGSDTCTTDIGDYKNSCP